MAKIQFSKLKLSKETEVSTIMIGGMEIEVKHYSPIQEKALIIDSILGEAFDYNFVNKAKADALFHFYLVMSYTNINFTKKEKDAPFETYDLLEKNGVIDAIVSAIPENEYNAFMTYAKDVMEDYDKYKNSILGVAEQIINQLPDRLNSVNSLMSSFDPADLKVLSNMVTEFGGSSEAVTNTVLGQE